MQIRQTLSLDLHGFQSADQVIYDQDSLLGIAKYTRPVGAEECFGIGWIRLRQLFNLHHAENAIARRRQAENRSGDGPIDGPCIIADDEIIIPRRGRASKSGVLVYERSDAWKGGIQENVFRVCRDGVYTERNTPIAIDYELRAGRFHRGARSDCVHVFSLEPAKPGGLWLHATSGEFQAMGTWKIGIFVFYRLESKIK